MTTQIKKKSNFSLISGIAGAVIGVGAAVAGAFVLKDKKNRDKVKKAFTEVKDKAEDYVEKVEKDVKKITNDLTGKKSTVKKPVKKVVKKTSIKKS